MRPSLFLTCEHGGNRVPERYRPLFQNARAALASHRGYDPGSLALGKALARHLNAPLVASTVTRLLIELNRSPAHRSLFSEFTRCLDQETKAEIIRRYYAPHREAIENLVAEAIATGRTALHVGVHTFTPILAGETRRSDVGLLYDPSREPERQFCIEWQKALRRRRPDLVVRRNYPYLGKADGLVTHLRRLHSPGDYLGIELELNQRHVSPRGDVDDQIKRDLLESFTHARTDFTDPCTC